MRLIEERRGSSVISYVYEPDSYVPLARLDATGDRTDQGGLGTQDDAALPPLPHAGEGGGEGHPASKTIAARASQTGAEGLNHSQPAANDAEALYWASLNQQAEQKAQALAIEGWGTGTDGPAKVSADAKIAEVYYFHTDQVGLPEELSNSQGQLVWQATYKTWGNTQAEEWKLVEVDGSKTHLLDAGDQPENEARQQNLRFQGQYLDRDTGLHYNTFRYYDPDIGRFISPDPIGLEGGINLGSYSPNPITWIDPWGWACSGRDTITRGPNGEITSVKGTVNPGDLGTGTATNASSRAHARGLGNATDDAGHTRGAQLGGNGGKKYVFPQDPHVNRGAFQVFEGRVADHVRRTGKSVDFEQTYHYGNGGTRPTGVTYSVTQNGRPILGGPQYFPN